MVRMVSVHYVFEQLCCNLVCSCLVCVCVVLLCGGRSHQSSVNPVHIHWKRKFCVFICSSSLSIFRFFVPSPAFSCFSFCCVQLYHVED